MAIGKLVYFFEIPLEPKKELYHYRDLKGTIRKIPKLRCQPAAGQKW